MSSRRGWVALLVLLFLAGVGGGWALSASHQGKAAPRALKQSRAERRVDARLRKVEDEVARERGLVPEGESPNPETPGGSSASEAPSQPPAPGYGAASSLLAGVTVVVDPGHNGANGSHPEEINRLVPAGAGGVTKACNTTGTATDDGSLTEAQFNFDIATKLRARLEAEGAEVVMTRTDNSGVGPCVNERAEIGNEAAADAVVSIHADGNLSPGAHGFDVIYPGIDEMVKPGMAETDEHLAAQLRNALAGAGIPPANYVGVEGLDERTDLAGLNLSTRPTAMVELGNMRSASEAAKLESAAYQARLAKALDAGIRRFIGTG